jgi:phosphoglycolate phosphatase-like HAD superfamily hydrolase
MKRLLMSAVALLLAAPALRAQTDPMPSWNDGAPKRAITAFVEKAKNVDAGDYVPPEQRIAVFDNDGTLWCEQPAYFQLLFAIDRVKAMAAQGGHPEWKDTEPFKSVLAGDTKALAAQGEKGIARLVAATHAGMTVPEFDAIVKQWISTATHPKTGKRYDEMVYQPMLELLAYLRAGGFKTYIVSGGGVDFMRAFAQETYGIPPEQVVGSRGEYRFETRDGGPVLVKLAEIDLIDDGPGKPVGIQQMIGRRPVMAFGNSDGDLQMLQYTTAGEGPRFALIVHHTDADREWAYDRDSHIGRLDKALDEAKAKGWTVVDMKNDWKRVFAFDE